MKIRRVTASGQGIGWAHWCEGCQCYHIIHTERPNALGAIWMFSGDTKEPSFVPDVKIFGASGETLCHYIVNKGMVQYLDGCAHGLTGKYELPEEQDPIVEYGGSAQSLSAAAVRPAAVGSGYRAYPAARYHREHEVCIVHNRAQDEALGEGWVSNPGVFNGTAEDTRLKDVRPGSAQGPANSYVYQPYPAVRYHPALPDRLVQNKEEDDVLLGQGWSKTPLRPAAHAEPAAQEECPGPVVTDDGLAWKCEACGKDVSNASPLDVQVAHATSPCINRRPPPVAEAPAAAEPAAEAEPVSEPEPESAGKRSKARSK